GRAVAAAGYAGRTGRGSGGRRQVTGAEMTTVAVVTGAGQGIGRAIARRLCGDGFAVALVDLNAGGLAETAEELGRDGAQTLQVQADLTEIGNSAGGLARAGAVGA